MVKLPSSFTTICINCTPSTLNKGYWLPKVLNVFTTLYLSVHHHLKDSLARAWPLGNTREISKDYLTGSRPTWLKNLKHIIDPADILWPMQSPDPEQMIRFDPQFRWLAGSIPSPNPTFRIKFPSRNILGFGSWASMSAVFLSKWVAQTNPSRGMTLFLQIGIDWGLKKKG